MSRNEERTQTRALLTKKGVLAFESGGTKLVAGVADSSGRLLETRLCRREPRAKAPASLERLIGMGELLKRKYESEGWSFGGAGFGFGGLVRRSTQETFMCHHEEGWNEIDTGQALRQKFGLPAWIENDCKVAALAEAQAGAGRGARTVFYVTIGTGVGGGMVQDGRIMEMSDVGEAEIGHVIVLPQGPKCGCGMRGCVEAVCSGPGMSALAAYMGAPRAMTSHELFAGWSAGNQFAARVVEKAANLLGGALATVQTLVNPDVFVIGGGVGSSLPAYVELLQRTARQWVVPYFRDRLRLECAELREQVVVHGAALLALQKLNWRTE